MSVYLVRIPMSVPVILFVIVFKIVLTIILSVLLGKFIRFIQDRIRSRKNSSYHHKNTEEEVPQPSATEVPTLIPSAENNMPSPNGTIIAD